MKYLACFAVFALVVGCGGSDVGSGGRGGAGGGNGGAGAAASGSGAGDGEGGLGGGGPQGGMPTPSGAECQYDSECEGGVCVAGSCCPGAREACGDACCEKGDVCSFGQCVTPGKECTNSGDCGEGAFCETFLTGEDEPAEFEVEEGCTQALPVSGQCLPLPMLCEDGESEDCVERCEFKPPAGELDAVVKWHWGADVMPKTMPTHLDVWSTPVVGRLADTNCDGLLDLNDPPAVVFMSGDVSKTQRQCASSDCRDSVLRAVDGRNGQELWTLDSPGVGTRRFAGLSPALADIDDDGIVEILAMSGDGHLVAVDGDGTIIATSDDTVPIPNDVGPSWGWGGGVAVADMDGDGNPEIAYADSLYTTDGKTLTNLFHKGMVKSHNYRRALSFFADLDHDDDLELVVGNRVYEKDGSLLWEQPQLPWGYNAVADFDGDGKPEVILNYASTVQGEDGKVWVLEGATGEIELGPLPLPGGGRGGPAVVADFDGDGTPEFGIAAQAKYTAYEADYASSAITVMWSADNHDVSSSMTGSSVFDFEGDGKAEVVYNDECFVWVYEGATGNILWTTNTTSFTGTEATIVADADGDGHAEIIVGSNGIDPSPSGWGCNAKPWNADDPASVRKAWAPPAGASNYRGVRVIGDRENSWVGTRTLWNQHSYSVTNVCSPRDSACEDPNEYGSVPKKRKRNWEQDWLNNFRQNVQDSKLFDAPDAVVSLRVLCDGTIRVVLENGGLAALPQGVVVTVYVEDEGERKELGTVMTDTQLLAGRKVVLELEAGDDLSGSFSAEIVIDEENRTFNECREDNNISVSVAANCGPE